MAAYRLECVETAFNDAYLDLPQADYEYLFGTELIPDGQGGVKVDKTSGALNGMLDGVELNGSDWESWKENLIGEFYSGEREKTVCFEPEWDEEITAADFCVSPELEAINSDANSLSTAILNHDVLLSH